MIKSSVSEKMEFSSKDQCTNLQMDGTFAFTSLVAFSIFHFNTSDNCSSPAPFPTVSLVITQCCLFVVWMRPVLNLVILVH